MYNSSSFFHFSFKLFGLLTFILFFDGHANGANNWASKIAPVKVISPNGSEKYKQGDTLKIKWEADPEKVNLIEIFISLDSGNNFSQLTWKKSIPRGDKEWNNFSWAIPATINNNNTVSTDCFIRIDDYLDQSYFDLSDKPFTIKTSVSVVPVAKKRRTGRLDLGINQFGLPQQLYGKNGFQYQINGAQSPFLAIVP